MQKAQLYEVKRAILEAAETGEELDSATLEKLSPIYDRSDPESMAAYSVHMIELENQSKGNLGGYDCPLCLNKGYTAELGEFNAFSVRQCSCMKVRDASKNIDRSGLSSVLADWTFDNFDAVQPWQITMKDTARRYVESIRNGGTDWLYISGQPGCGKTHLCTAVCGELLKDGNGVRYMVWRDEAERIKADRLDSDAMENLLYPLKQAEVLYIDDLHKGVRVERGKLVPTDAENRLCFEILNARWMRKKPTIITCEWSLTEDLLDVDEATFSRAYQQAKKFACQIGLDRSKNYRLHGG